MHSETRIYVIIYYYSYQISENMTYSTQEGWDKHTLAGKPEMYHVEDANVDGRIILKCAQDSSCSGQCNVADSYKYDNEP